MVYYYLILLFMLIYLDLQKLILIITNNQQETVLIKQIPNLRLNVSIKQNFTIMITTISILILILSNAGFIYTIYHLSKENERLNDANVKLNEFINECYLKLNDSIKEYENTGTDK